MSWGAQNVWAKVSGGSWTKLPDAMDGSVEMTTTKGDKLEALVEGGEPEAVKYKKNTYELAYNTRMLSQDGTPRKKPFADDNGVVREEPSICIVPEDASAPGLFIKRAHVSLETAYNASDGGAWQYTLEAMKNSDGTPMVVYGVVTVDSTTGAPSSITPIDSLTGETSTDAITL